MHGQTSDVAGGDALEESGRARAGEMVLHHVGDVEEGGALAGEVVGVEDGEGGVLDGHGVAAEGDHFAAVAEVEVVEGGFGELFFGSCRGGGIAGGLEGGCWD